MSNEDTYNGWVNRETWAFNLHWQNDEGFYGFVLDYARQALEDNESLSDYGLGFRVLEYVQAELPELSPELWELMREDVGSFWRVDADETGACVRESLSEES